MDGEFLVAGIEPSNDKLLFFNGFNMCHRKNYDDVLSAIRAAKGAIETAGISNFKLHAHECVRFCKMCGANLRDHYGDDGGLLRDDEYVRILHDLTWSGS
jgi:hypothetical protein